jgi:hypothetical protein
LNTWWLLVALVIAGVWMSTLQRRIEKLEKRNKSLESAVMSLAIWRDKTG